HPYYVIRATGGVLFLLGALVMVYNLVKTVRAGEPASEPIAAPLGTKAARVEKNVVLLAIGVVLTVAIGGLVEIIPLHTIKSTIEPVQGMRPYTPLEL